MNKQRLAAPSQRLHPGRSASIGLGILAASLVLSCGSSPAAPTDPNASTLTLAAPPPGQGVQYRMETTIAAGTEDERCQFVQAPEDLWVNHEEVRYTPGSHHFILWNTPYTSIPTVDNGGNTVDTTKVFDCVGGPAAGWNVNQFVGGAQSADAPPMLSDLPADVALHIPAGAVMVMDLHVLNPSPSPLDPTVLINLDTIPHSQVNQEAGIYFFYDPFIRVPPNATGQARMSCPVTSDLTMTTAQTHMHKWGLGGTAILKDSTGATLQDLYTSDAWTDPPVTLWPAPGMPLKTGQQVDYQCNYQNAGSTAVLQGGSAATNEMCVFAGAYYPRDAKFESCSTTGNWADLGSAATYIGTGTATCLASMECVNNAKDAGALYGCMVDSCAAVATPLTAAWDCFQANGADAQTACASQIATCAAASCN